MAQQPMPSPGKENVAPSLKQRFNDWIDARTTEGIETYGTPLQTFNGRDSALDAFQEILDFSQYQEQSRMEALARIRQLEEAIKELRGKARAATVTPDEWRDFDRRYGFG